MGNVRWLAVSRWQDCDVARPVFRQGAWLGRRELRIAFKSVFIEPALDRPFDVLETLQAPA